MTIMTTCMLTLLPSCRSQSFAVGTCLADALFDMGVMLKTPCGGRGTCGKCLVQVEGIIASAATGPVAVSSGWYPACHTFLHGAVQVRLPEEIARDKGGYVEISPYERYGLAIDIGTTTVKLALVDTAGEIHALDAFLNPQRRYGDDVISRIAAADDPAVHARLSDLIRQAIAGSLSQALTHMGLPYERIESLAVSGNTTMLYLLLGLDVASLGRAPYVAAEHDFDGLSLDLGLLPDKPVSILPIQSAFLGADLVGGLAICHELGYQARTLFIDLGTNGELFLIDPQGQVWAASCAMGPALEGMNISCGMTAAEGAITHVRDENHSLDYEMLGQGIPAGISGTALIDLLAIFLKKGGITSQGNLLPVPLPSPAHFVGDQGHKRIDLWDTIAITQKDIRQVQLAKGASLAASRRLLTEAGCVPDDIEQVIIAGAFGAHLDLANFRRLGFLPHLPRATYTYIGNTSLMAAAAACREPAFMEQARRLRDQVREVALAQDQGFQRLYLDALAFPNDVQ